jgi:hypothetical protein
VIIDDFSYALIEWMSFFSACDGRSWLGDNVFCRNCHFFQAPIYIRHSLGTPICGPPYLAGTCGFGRKMECVCLWSECASRCVDISKNNLQNSDFARLTTARLVEAAAAKRSVAYW